MVASPPLVNSDHVVLSVSIVFLSNSKWEAPFHRTAYGYFRASRVSGLPDQLRDVPWEDIFKLDVSAVTWLSLLLLNC